METYPKFKYDSHSTTLEDNFNKSAYGEVEEIQSSSIVELGGGDTTKEDVDE